MNLDHNAGGRVRPEVIDAVTDWLREDAANPSSVHAAGRRAREAVEAARDAVAALVEARPGQVVFTSGGTEANNLAIRGVVEAGAHVVSSTIEHASVLRPLEAVRVRGCQVTLLEPARDGSIAPARVASALRDETRLVTIGWANGEIGTVQPIEEIAAAVRERACGAVLHSDAVQAAGACAIDLGRVPLDLVSLSGHKIGALPGIGALIVRRDVAVTAQMLGGPHERDLRAGTENVPGIVSFGVAARLARVERASSQDHLRRVRARVLHVLEAAAPLVVHGAPEGLPGTLSVAFPGLRADALVIALDLEGVAAATGPACAAGAAEPSHVLRAIGCADDVVRATLRLSFGADLSFDDAERAARAVVACVARARGRRGAGVGHAA